MQKSTSHNQFVVAEHTAAGRVHWDLMLEHEGVLWTWRLDIHPAVIHGPASAKRIFDHPLKFLTYEGPVQNGTGSVSITDKGGLRFQQLEPETITVELDGNILKGCFTLEQTDAPQWTLTKINR